MSKDTCTIQITLRGSESPMINIYADTAADTIAHLQELLALGLNDLIYQLAPPPAPKAETTPTSSWETPQAPAPAQRESQDGTLRARLNPDEQHPVCPKHGEPMERRTVTFQKNGQDRSFISVECRERDDDEPNGWCRWQFNEKTGELRQRRNAG